MKYDMTKVNEKTLTKLHACEDGKKWFLETFGELDITEINDIEGDHEGYVTWLKEKYLQSTYDDQGNELTYEDPDGWSYTNTNDDQGNVLTLENSDDYSRTKTYDKQGNQLTYENSDGFSWVSTYDDQGNELTFENSDGYSCVSTYDNQGNELTFEEFQI